MEPQNAIGYLLPHVAFVWGRQLDRRLQERLGIGLAQFRILTVLQQRPEIAQRELAVHLGQTEPGISRQVTLLCAKGLLARRVRPQNKRVRLVEPTPKGLKIIEAAQAIAHAQSAGVLANMGDKQQRQLAEALAALHTGTCQPGKMTACDHPFAV